MFKKIISTVLILALMLGLCVTANAAYAGAAVGEPDYVRGDADGDGQVTNRDAMLLDRYVAGWKGYGERIKVMAAMDLNGDGDVNNRDAMILDRYVAGWKGYAKYITGEEEPVQPTEPKPTEPKPTEPAVPKITKVESGNKGVIVTWDAFDGAELYRVFYKTGGSSWKKLGDTASTTFTHTDAPYNKECLYTVRCVDKNGNFTSDYDKAGYANTRLKNPVLKSAKLMDLFIGVSWEAVEGAEYYHIYIKGGEFASWTPVYSTDCSGVTYCDLDTGILGLKSNTKYSFTVQCTDSPFGERSLSGYDTTGVSVKYYDTPCIYAIYNDDDGIVLYWSEVDGVSKYRVFEWIDGGWKKLTDTKDTAICVTGYEEGDWARFTVRGLDSKGEFITPYDTYGRFMDRNSKLIGYDSHLPEDGIEVVVENLNKYLKGLGFTLDENALVDSDLAEYYLMDYSGYYGASDYLEAFIIERCKSMIDYFVKKMKRSGADPRDQACGIMPVVDENGFVDFYFTTAPLVKSDTNIH